MCGISGIISSENVSAKLQQSLQNLEYRGYDSCGIAVLNGQGTVIRKDVGYVADVAEKVQFSDMKGMVGIAHTRWATHGAVTSLNAHPHICCEKKIAIVHNGIVDNYQKLKNKLIKKKHKFKSLTDSEVIVHLIEDIMNKKGQKLEDAFILALKQLEGTFAVAMISSDEPGRIYCGKHESPLIIGIGNEENYIGSDFNAFIEHTKNAVVLDDGEYAILSSEGYAVKKISNSEPVSKNITRIEWDAEAAQKGGFPHYMLKEIHEQPESITRVLEISRESIQHVAQKILDAKNNYLIGVGTTYYSAMVGQYYFSAYAGIMVPAVSSDEVLESFPMKKDDFVLAVSQSGETYDTCRAIKTAKKVGANTAAIVNVMGSTMARMVDYTIMQSSGPEICVVSTKVAIAQMTTLMRIALEVGVMTKKITKAKKVELLKQLKTLPKIISRFLNENSGFVHSLAQRQAEHDNWLYLGRGIYYPVALESALKVKEVAYQHAEGMSAGFLKHGTIALIDDKIRSMFFMPPEKEKEIFKLTMGAMEEIKARGGYLVAFHNSKLVEKSNLLDDQLILPKSHPFIAPIISLVAAQLYSYFLAITLDRNVDKPRALAKSVTVA